MLIPLAPGDLAPGSPVLAELAQLYAGNAAFHRLSGEFGPDPETVSPAEVAGALSGELAMPGVEVLLVRVSRPETTPDAGGESLAGVVALLDTHPVDGFPWIGLLMVDARRQGRGLGREVAEEVHERLRRAGRPGVRLAVLVNNPAALAFWTRLDYTEIDRRPDLQAGRDCVVMHRDL
ncbi:GNAT family N-acetyltransferase [Catellatospora sp. NPDC049111]|uniref:GNAT family N-acetyltransferase n=1 Tax=Catellatospora aurea TaxID=1337874 RepID=A0ABW2GUZ8_9ACTN